MITKVRELFNTEDSHFFTSAVKRCNMEDYDYAEREFLFTGTANIYCTGPDGMPQVKYPDCTYTNRMMLRQPRDPKKFSGRVVLEIVNSTANFDIDRVWAESHRYLMRHGDVFVGVTSKANVFTALRRFDPVRYAELNWPNPSQEPVPQNDEPPIWTGPQDQETGYIWDILKQVPALLRGDSELNPLAGWGVRYVYLAGWSQSCSYMTQYITSFETREDHAYDGYLSTGGVRFLSVPLNRYESVLPVDSLRKRLNNAPAPVIELNTESEASDEFYPGGFSSRRPDCDDEDFPYRYVDVAAACHDSVDTCMGYNSFDGDVAKAMGMVGGGPPGNSICMNDYHKYFQFHLVLRDLYLWAEQGVTPRRYPRMKQDSHGRILKDAFGNSIGGLRTPLVNFPVCTYYNWTEEVNPTTGVKRLNALAGHEVDFSPAFLKELYGSLEQYTSLVTQDAKRLVQEGHILREDLEAMIADCVARARQAGLE